MGRKKRKAADLETSTDDAEAPSDASEPKEPAAPVVQPESKQQQPASSTYAVTSHGAEIVEEDIYVSDGSEDEEDEVADIMLSSSRMGLMRRGLHQSLLVQPNRQWQRETQEADVTTELEDEKREQELAKLDPAQRAARLLAEKQRKLEEAKETARRLESEENAGRDPCLFSKRTAFDIRMDQVEDKPWERGAGDLTDFFNYSLTEDDWVDYSQQQLQIRQELTDASRQRRAPDLTIVPVTPRAPHKQAPRVAVIGSTTDGDATDDAVIAAQIGEVEPVVGPVMVKKDDDMDVDDDEAADADDKKEDDIKHVGSGGAWGAGAAPGSMLARLIEEQERKEQEQNSGGGASSSWEQNAPDRMEDDRYSDRHEDNVSQDGSQQSDWREREYAGRYPPEQGHFPPQYGRRGGHFPPPPPQHHGGLPPPYYGGGRGRGGYRQAYPPNPNMPPPPPHWGGRGGTGGFRGRQDDYGGGGYRR